MDTIILDWVALSQIIQQGPGSALEQALGTSGSQLAVTNYGFDEIPQNFRADFNAVKNRLNIQTIDVPADFTVNTLENRQLGLAYDTNGNLTNTQIADASYKWLEQNNNSFSNGSYRLLTNERALINHFSDIAPNSVITTNLDLLGRAVLRGDITTDQYKGYIRDFGLSNGDIKSISPDFNDLILDQNMLQSIEMNNFGSLNISDSDFVKFITNSKTLAAAGIAGDVFALSITVSVINDHLQNGDEAAAEVEIAKFTAGLGGGALATTTGATALAAVFAPEFFTTVGGAVVLLGLAVLGGYVGGEVAEAFTETLVTRLQAAHANGESLLVEDIIEVRDQFFTDNNLDPGDFRTIAIDGQLTLVESCFLAGTPIDMWPSDPSIKPGTNGLFDEAEIMSKVWQKPIEEITSDDWVLSFDKNNNLKPGKVKRTFTQKAKIILDFFGTGVTPGHVYYRADSEKAYKFETLIDILRDDGVIVESDGTELRAATGLSTDDPRNNFVWAVTGEMNSDGSVHIKEKGRIRLGTRFIANDGRDLCVYDLIETAGGTVTDEGFIRVGENGNATPFHWAFSDTLPRPEDYILERSGTSLEDIYKAAEWESQRPHMPPPMVIDGGPVQPFSRSDLTDMPRNIPLEMQSEGYAASSRPALNRKQRKAAEAKSRKSAKSNDKTVH